MSILTCITSATRNTAKLVSLFLLATLGACCAIGVAIVTSDSLLHGSFNTTYIRELSSYDTSLEEYLLIMLLPGSSLFGFAHVFLSYIILLRPRQFFWRNYWIIAPTLVVGAGLLSGLSEYILHSSVDTPTFYTRLIAIPTAFWILAWQLSKTSLCGELGRRPQLRRRAKPIS